MAPRSEPSPHPLQPYRLSRDRYLTLLRSESDRFAEALAGADRAARVPACPDWDAADLLWHLTEVQGFWGTIAGERRGTHEGIDKRPRPDAWPDLLESFRTTSAELSRALGTGDDSEPVWTWAEDDRTLGFVRRRQAHEALIHRLDAELTVGDHSPLDPELATDGIDEALRVMYGGTPSWAAFTRATGPLLLETTDTGGGWLVDVGRLTGTDPRDGEVVDEPALEVIGQDGAGTALAEVRADAGTLDAWLWNRVRDDAVDMTGDPEALAALSGVVRTGLQ